MGKIHIGTMGWSYSFWVGNFYPRGLMSKHFLAEYSKHFDTVEVDNTFYRIPKTETVTEWKDQTPEDFLFAVKLPRIITHIRMLKDCEEVLERFIERITQLQEKLGPLLIQLPPRFGQEHTSLLGDFLTTLPKGYRFTIEVRNQKLLQNKFFSLLRRNDVALALVDNYSIHYEEATADFVYVRLRGDRVQVNGTLGKPEVDRTEDIMMWAEKIRTLSDDNEVFVYFSKYYSGYPPGDAMTLSQLLRARGQSKDSV